MDTAIPEVHTVAYPLVDLTGAAYAHHIFQYNMEKYKGPIGLPTPVEYPLTI